MRLGGSIGLTGLALLCVVSVGTAAPGSVTVDGKTVTYGPSARGAPFAEFAFETKGYRNTYTLDCAYRQFKWTKNVKLATGEVTNNTEGAEWRPLNSGSQIANTIFHKICGELGVFGGIDESLPLKQFVPILDTTNCAAKCNVTVGTWKVTLDRVAVDDKGTPAFLAADAQGQCGMRGCNALFVKRGERWQKLFETADHSFKVLPSRTNGQADLLAYESEFSSGVRNVVEARYVWDGKSYGRAGAAQADATAMARPGHPGWQAAEGTGCLVWNNVGATTGDTVTWSGACKNNKADGEGEAVWRIDGKEAKYVGRMRDGKLNGYGMLTSLDGSRYGGEWVNNELKHGTFTDKDGRYEGDFVDGNFEGHGTLVLNNGDRAEGTWVKGHQHGHGVYTWADGTRYEGDFRDGKITGNGIKTFADGTRQEGTWVHGKFVVQCGETKFQNLTPNEGKALAYVLERKQGLQGIACITELVATEKFPLRGQTVIKYRAKVVFPNGYNTKCLNLRPQKSIEDGGFPGFFKQLDCSSPGMAPARPGEVRQFSGDEVI